MEELKAKQTELEQSEENQSVSVDKKNKLIFVLKIIVAIIYFAMTAFLTWGLIDALATLNAPVPEGQMNFNSLGMAVYLVVIVLIMGLAVYSTNMVLSIVGLVLSNKKKASKGTKIYFIVFIILPVITEILFFMLGLLLGSNG